MSGKEIRELLEKAQRSLKAAEILLALILALRQRQV